MTKTTSDAELIENLPSLLNIDQVLWQLAVSNVFMDDDGYIHKGGDYTIYQDVKGRFHLVPHDNNESIRFGREGRGGALAVEAPAVGRGGIWKMEWHLLWRMTAMQRARLFSDCFPTQSGVPRYLAHVRTVINEWLDWGVLGPIVNEYQELIDAEVQQDDKKLYSYQDFATNSPADLERFVTQRREYLRNHPELNKPSPQITTVELGSGTSPVANQPVSVKATLDKSLAADSVFLYYSDDRYAVFNQVLMTAEKESFVGGTDPCFSSKHNRLLLR